MASEGMDDLFMNKVQERNSEGYPSMLSSPAFPHTAVSVPPPVGSSPLSQEGGLIICST